MEYSFRVWPGNFERLSTRYGMLGFEHRRTDLDLAYFKNCFGNGVLFASFGLDFDINMPRSMGIT